MLSDLERRLCRVAIRQLGVAVDPDEVMAAEPLAMLVGEYNPYNPGECALWPHPRTSAGHKLFQMSGMELPDYLKAFLRVNLVDEAKWSKVRARENASKVLERAASYGIPVVALGCKVIEAFGCQGDFFSWTHDGRTPILRVPHPSPLSRAYNTPETRERLGIELRRALDFGRWPPHVVVPVDHECQECGRPPVAPTHPKLPSHPDLRVLCETGGVANGSFGNLPYRVVRPWGSRARGTSAGYRIDGVAW